MAIRDVFFFWLPAIMLLWTFIGQFLHGDIFISLGSIPKSGIAGLYDNFIFNLLSNCKVAVAFYILPAIYKHASFLPPCQHLLFFFIIFIIAILVGMKWFWFTFSWQPMGWVSFLCTCWPFVYFVCRKPFKVLCSIVIAFFSLDLLIYLLHFHLLLVSYAATLILMVV